MEFTREIYWNIGSGVILPMYLLSFVAIALCIWGFYRRIALYRQGKDVERFDQPAVRIHAMLRLALQQTKVLRVKKRGGFHAFFFWSFLLLFIGTLLIMLQADLTDPVFGYVFLKGTFYLLFSLVLDIAGAVGIVMLAFLMARRFFTQPKEIESIRDDYAIHGMLFAILVTGFLVEGARMAATEIPQASTLMWYSPVGLVFGQLFTSLHADTVLALHSALWWLHFLIVLAFIVAIPFTKLRHIFTIPANYFLGDLRAKGTLAPIPLEDETIEQYGVSTIHDLTWKDIFDTDACISCQRCQDRCPAYVTDKPLSPMKLIQQIGEVAVGENPQTSLAECVTHDVLWSCTTCRACQDICPANVEHVNKIIGMRQSLSLMEGEFPGDEVRTAIGNIEVNGNPFGLAYASRGDWADGLDVARLSEGETADILYFAGCYASFDKRNRDVARSFIAICNAAGLRVGILGKEEKCCGEPVRKLGNEYLFQMQATENVETIKGYGVSRIVTTCPHCFNTLSRDYKDFGLDIPVEHHSIFIQTLIDEGKLDIAGGLEAFSATYHDSCYLSRYKDITQEPRKTLAQVGGTIQEMEKHGIDGFCCGAGGGRILAEETLGKRINVERVRMAAETNVPLLVANCPFCLTMFEDGIKTGGFEENLKVMDLAEVVVNKLSLSK
ncbi:heterodisulfide reductase-related iron-sulfur binding cluster [Chrysiogenes arsenatis]|uniref:heterodisulfide reductase-related iron-sulfur binding cluster n=1 Tax=Chrysiogenes arsenatis TaxID=309797 RepID=UPI00040AFCC8|nr:heterodisulfide reductase-related iron-sulfur binding cluster [Chrysiogenes arsenatis]